MTQVADRKFVTFDAAQIDVNQIVALAYQLQDGQGIDKDGKPVATRVQVAVVMLENGSSVTLGGSSLEKFEHWWKENVKREKVELPAAVEAPALVANTNTPDPAAVAVPPLPVPPTPPVEPPAPEVPIEAPASD